MERLPSKTLRERSPQKRRSKNKVFLQGLAVLDGRSPAVRQYVAARRELVEQLGGAENISAAQRFLVEMTVRGLIYLNHLDAHLYRFARELTGPVEPGPHQTRGTWPEG